MSMELKFVDRGLTRSIVLALLPLHLNRYRDRLRKARLGQPGVRGDELEVLVGLWQSMEAKDCDPALFLPEELAEARDAAYDEGLLEPDEPDEAHP